MFLGPNTKQQLTYTWHSVIVISSLGDNNISYAVLSNIPAMKTFPTAVATQDEGYGSKRTFIGHSSSTMTVLTKYTYDCQSETYSNYVWILHHFSTTWLADWTLFENCYFQCLNLMPASTMTQFKFRRSIREGKTRMTVNGIKHDDMFNHFDSVYKCADKFLHTKTVTYMYYPPPSGCQ